MAKIVYPDYIGTDEEKDAFDQGLDAYIVGRSIFSNPWHGANRGIPTASDLWGFTAWMVGFGTGLKGKTG